MSMSENISEAIPLLTVHCIRQCVDGCDPDDKLLETLKKYDNYWDVYQNVSYSMKNYQAGTGYTLQSRRETFYNFKFFF